jgi:hypothetical protein
MAIDYRNRIVFLFGRKEMKAVRYTVLLIGLLFFAIPAAWAEGLTIEPGKWKMTSTMTMPMLPQPRVTTTTECIEKSEISMDDMGGEEMDPNCKIETAQIDVSTIKWSFDCPVEGGTSHGEWEATSGGDTVTGEGLMTVSFQGQNMEMTMNWTGRRIGACDL